MDARHLGLPTGWFDIVLCGFMGWDDCFDFAKGRFTQPDTKASEIRRVLRDGGRFVCCAWERQEDLNWMEEAMLRHCPALLEDGTYLEQRPIGMSYEKAEGYEVILRTAGFREIEILRETMTFISTDEEEWWRQMQAPGWEAPVEKIKNAGPDHAQRLKEAILRDLRRFKQADGIQFDKEVFLARGVK